MLNYFDRMWFVDSNFAPLVEQDWSHSLGVTGKLLTLMQVNEPNVVTKLNFKFLFTDGMHSVLYHVITAGVYFESDHT